MAMRTLRLAYDAKMQRCKSKRSKHIYDRTTLATGKSVAQANDLQAAPCGLTSRHGKAVDTDHR